MAERNGHGAAEDRPHLIGREEMMARLGITEEELADAPEPEFEDDASDPGGAGLPALARERWDAMVRMGPVPDDEGHAAGYRLVVESDPCEGGYVAHYPALPGCITCADTLPGILGMAADAMREWMLATAEDGRGIPAPDGGGAELRLDAAGLAELASLARAAGAPEGGAR